ARPGAATTRAGSHHRHAQPRDQCGAAGGLVAVAGDGFAHDQHAAVAGGDGGGAAFGAGDLVAEAGDEFAVGGGGGRAGGDGAAMAGLVTHHDEWFGHFNVPVEIEATASTVSPRPSPRCVQFHVPKVAYALPAAAPDQAGCFGDLAVQCVTLLRPLGFVGYYQFAIAIQRAVG